MEKSRIILKGVIKEEQEVQEPPLGIAPLDHKISMETKDDEVNNDATDKKGSNEQHVSNVISDPHSVSCYPGNKNLTPKTNSEPLTQISDGSMDQDDTNLASESNDVPLTAKSCEIDVKQCAPAMNDSTVSDNLIDNHDNKQLPELFPTVIQKDPEDDNLSHIACFPSSKPTIDTEKGRESAPGKLINIHVREENAFIKEDNDHDDSEQAEKMEYRTAETMSDDLSRDSSSDESSEDDTSSESSDEGSSSSDSSFRVREKENGSTRKAVQKKGCHIKAIITVPDEDGEKTSDIPPKTKGELSVDDLPPIEELTINLDDSVIMEEVGHVVSVIGLLVIVQANRELPALNEDSILFIDGKKVLGQIFEIFGPVPAPLYSVRFNSSEDIEDRDLKPGKQVYYAPGESWLTNYVFVEQLRRLKGSDASWEHNNEPPPKFLDYSDDEEERRAKAKKRGKDVPPKDSAEQEQPGKKKRASRQRNKNSTNDSGSSYRDLDAPGGRGGPFNRAPFNQNPFKHMHQGPRYATENQLRFQNPRGPGMHQMRGFPPRGFEPPGPRFGEMPHGHWNRGPGFRQFRPSYGPNPRMPYAGPGQHPSSAYGRPPYFQCGPQDQSFNSPDASAHNFMNNGRSHLPEPPSHVVMPCGPPQNVGHGPRFRPNADPPGQNFNTCVQFSDNQMNYGDPRTTLVDSRFMQNNPG